MEKIKSKKTSKSFQDTTADKIFMIFIYIILTLALLIVLLPLLHVVAASFSSPSAVTSGKVTFWPIKPTFKAYQAVISNQKILTGFMNSFIYMIIGTSLNIVMTLLCAYPLSRREFKARNLVSALLVFTMYFSGGLVPTYMVVNNLHLTDTRAAMIIPVAMSVWNVIICRTFIAGTIPDALYEAASLDGCSPFGFLLRIVIPLSAPVIAVLVLYYGINHWNTYFNALIYLNSNKLMPLQIILREILVLSKVDNTMLTNAQAMMEKQGLTDLLKYAVIVVASLPVMIIYPFVQKYFVQGVMIGAVKG